MSVLVRVKVSDGNAGGLQLADLGGGFGFDFIGRQAAQHRERPKLADALAEARIAGAVTAAVQQTVDLRLGKQGSAVHQDDVASHSQSRRGLRQTHRLRKCLAVGHQRRRTHDAVFVGLDDGTIHARRETKIVSVDDQAAHRASLAGMCREERRAMKNHVGTAALGCPAERSSAIVRQWSSKSPARTGRAALDWTAEGGCPHVFQLSRVVVGPAALAKSKMPALLCLLRRFLLGPDFCPSRFLRPADCGSALGAQGTARSFLRRSAAAVNSGERGQRRIQSG